MNEHYYTKNPSTPLQPLQISFTLHNTPFTFTTGSGVFAKKRVDKGTRVLARYAEITGTEKLLDLGCGYGVIGIVLKKKHPSLDVTCSDINERAVELCRHNALLNQVILTSKTSDGFTHLAEKFDCILLNPPQTAGKAICERLIKESFIHLNNNGNLQVVARTHKGGGALSAFMNEVFGNIRTVKAKSGYRVYLSVKR